MNPRIRGILVNTPHSSYQFNSKAKSFSNLPHIQPIKPSFADGGIIDRCTGDDIAQDGLLVTEQPEKLGLDAQQRRKT
jgi:hypothetical protein